eukprot:CCRYP_015450-RD/>CCRYP_015450-RD protein AED:0.40 eAED:0.81 QI:79/0/0.5/1/0/0/2/0/260
MPGASKQANHRNSPQTASRNNSSQQSSLLTRQERSRTLSLYLQCCLVREPTARAQTSTRSMAELFLGWIQTNRSHVSGPSPHASLAQTVNGLENASLLIQVHKSRRRAKTSTDQAFYVVMVQLVCDLNAHIFILNPHPMRSKLLPYRRRASLYHHLTIMLSRRPTTSNPHPQIAPKQLPRRKNVATGQAAVKKIVNSFTLQFLRSTDLESPQALKSNNERKIGEGSAASTLNQYVTTAGNLVTEKDEGQWNSSFDTAPCR